MEDLSCHYSPKVRQFMSTQTTDFTTSRFSTGCNFCPGTPTYQKEDLTATDLKREYSKAMNCIEILKLEKKNLQDALNLTKDFKKDKTDKYFVSSTRSNTAISPRAEFRPTGSLEAERKILELEQELLEHRRLHDKSLAHNEILRRENYSYKERLQEVDNLQLQNHALKNNLKELSEELKMQTQKNYELEDEKDQLIERRTHLNASAKKLPPRELYKYLDHVYELIGSLNKNHYAHYHFRECFVDEANIETLIEEKETNQLLLQSFRYITNLLMNINASAPSNDQRRPSHTLLTESGSENQRRNNNMGIHNNTGYSNNVEYPTEEDVDAYSLHVTGNSQASRNLNFNGMSREIEVEPHSFGESKPLSQQNLSPEHYNQNQSQSNNNNTRGGHSPANSRNMLTNNSYSHKANTDLNTSKKELSRNPSYKSGISVASPKTRERSPSGKSAAADKSGVNVSKQSIARSHVSQRQNTGGETNNQLNASRYSQGKSVVSHHRDADNNAVNISRYSQKNYQGQQQATQQHGDGDYVLERSGNARNNNTQDLDDREMKIRELDRELREKDRLLQLREKELKDKSVMEKSTARYRTQEEPEVNRSTISQSRKIASQRSVAKDQSPQQSRHQSRQRIDDSRMMKSQAHTKNQSQFENERSNNNLNKSNSVIQSRIIPSITSLNENIDASPKAYGASPKYSQSQVKSFTRVAGSNQNLDARSDMHGSPKNFSTVNSQKMLNVISAHDANEVSYPGVQRISFQDAYMGAHSFDNSPQSKISPKPQTLDRLENSEARYADQREYEGQFYDSAPAYMGSPKSDAKRHITFDVRNLGDIEECESPAHSKSLSRKMSAGESGRKGTEYASFRVSFGRTQSKYMRSQSPDIDAKDSLYIVDVARRKKVTHHEQTYDIVQGNEVRYDLNPMGPDYSVSKNKPRSKYEPQSQNSLSNQSGQCERNLNFSSPVGTYRVDQTPQK